MPGATTRAFEAGKALGLSLIETVHLMYQNQTALSFLRGLTIELSSEREKREKEKDE